MRSRRFAQFFLSALNLMIFFIAIRFFIDPNVGTWFWAMFASLLVLQVYSQIRGLHALQYYAIYMLFTILFGYYVQSGIGVSFLTYSSKPDTITPGIFLISLTNLVGMIVGAEMQMSRRKRKARRAPTKRLNLELPSVSALPSLLFLLAVAIIAAVFLFGPDVFLGTRIDRYLNEKVSAYVAFSFQVLKLLPYVISIALLSSAQREGARGPFFWAFLMVLALSLVVSNPINTARFISLTALSLLFALWISVAEKSKYIPIAINVFPFLASVLLPLTSQLRQGLNQISWSTIVAKYSSLEFSSVQMMIAAQKISTTYDGLYTLSGLLVFVPRSIFPWKADSLGISVAEQSGFVFFNSAVPSFFSPYMDFGPGGVFVFGIVSGYVLAWATLSDKMYWFDRHQFYKLVIFALVPIFGRGDFSTFMISFYAITIAYETTRFMARLVFSRANSTTYSKWI